eukprot:g5470.t2
MKTRKRGGILGRLSRINRESKKNNQVNDKTTEVEPCSASEDDSTAVTNHGENKLNRTLSGISEDLQSSFSSDSNVTSASDLMKCLNGLRIQEASVTNSNSTPSAASVPRLAPPPKIQSEPNGSTELLQTWPRLDVVNSNGKTSFAKMSLSMSSSLSKSKQNQPPTSSSSWTAFTASDINQSASSDLVKSVSVHARSSSCVSEQPPMVFETKTGQDSIQEEDEVVVEQSSEPPKELRSAFQNHWRDSDDEAETLPSSSTVQINPFAEPAVQSEGTGDITTSVLMKTTEESNFDCIVRKYGAPVLELVETVDVCFSGNKITKCHVWGEVKFKLSGGTGVQNEKLSSTAMDCLEVYRFLLRLKCVVQHVLLKKITVKKSLIEWDEFHQSLQSGGSMDRTSSLTMNEAKNGIVESKTMQWSLAKCYQEALINPVTLMKYPAQCGALNGPPLLVQIHWQKPKRPGLPVLVDVVLLPNGKLTTSLWGVTVCLKGFGGKDKANNKLQVKEALASPEAKWNPIDCSFEWSIPIINPEDSARHLKVKVSEDQVDEIPDYDLSALIKFVMPHSTLSGTLLMGWIEPKFETESDVLFGDGEKKRRCVNSPKNAINANTGTDSNLIFCEKMCLSGNYEANTNY